MGILEIDQVAKQVLAGTLVDHGTMCVDRGQHWSWSRHLVAITDLGRTCGIQLEADPNCLGCSSAAANTYMLSTS